MRVSETRDRGAGNTMKQISKVVASLDQSGQKRDRMALKSFALGNHIDATAQKAAAYAAWDLADALSKLEEADTTNPTTTRTGVK